MKVLVVGKTAREQAFIQKISESKRADKIWCIPGNPQIAKYAECVNIPISDLTSMVEFAKENEIDLTIALDEYAIQEGISNIFQQEKLKIFAPTLDAAQIGTSRAFAKKFLFKNKIPTPKYGLFDKEQSAIDYLKKSELPLFVKYDHLAHQDSFLCTSYTRAKNTITKVFEEVQKKVVLEEFVEGDSVRFSILTDGYYVLPLPYVKEYKRQLDGEGGAFVKSIGAYTPYNKVTSFAEKDIAEQIVFPVLDALNSNGTPYQGFLSIQIIIQPNGNVQVVEFLPTIDIAEATCIFQLLNDDLLDVIYSATEDALEDCYQNLSFAEYSVASVALMSGSYPDNPKLNSVVDGIEDLDEDNIELFYNDVGMNSYYEVVTTGGRPFFMTSKALTINKAVNNLYDNIDIIKFDGKNYRRDIGKIPVYKNY